MRTPYFEVAMTEKELLVSKILDKKKHANDNSMITNSSFLTMEEKSEISFLEREMNDSVNTWYYGGYDDAERCVAVFIPTYFDIGSDITEYFSQNADDNPISLIRLTKDRFSNLSHRDYLGALMGLGIKREVVGDIITCDDGCYFFCLKSMEKFICENLDKSGRGTVRCSVCDVNDLPVAADNFTEEFISTASMRLDSIVALSFGLSRSKAAEAINKGIVYVNSSLITKADHCLTCGDKLVLRGKGKVVLKEISGYSKKGRLHLIIKKYK